MTAVDARGRHPTGRAGRARVERQGLFLGLAFLIAVFNLLGLVMVMSASSEVARDDYGSAWYFVVRQAAWAAAGAVALLVIARTDYHRWRRPAGPFLVVALLLLVLCLVPGIGVSANGATRWIGTGSLSFQPSELAKLAV
ncbi:MAG: FtsW/RodA/SpoVE family cell cycle protein, partial [Acidimicrobiia bacterium]